MVKEVCVLKLAELIQEGESIKKDTNSKEYSGERYERWKANSVLFMEKNFTTETLTKRLIKATEKSDEKGYGEVLGILKAVNDSLYEKISKNIEELSDEELEVEIKALEK